MEMDGMGRFEVEKFGTMERLKRAWSLGRLRKPLLRRWACSSSSRGGIAAAYCDVAVTAVG